MSEWMGGGGGEARLTMAGTQPTAKPWGAPSSGCRSLPSPCCPGVEIPRLSSGMFYTTPEFPGGMKLPLLWEAAG